MSETMNDVIVETLNETVNALIEKVTPWKALQVVPEPENSKEILEEIRNDLLTKLSYVRSIAKKRKKKYILCDKVRL